MDQLNFRNMLLAYHAVHDDVLCESMDELGFFDEQEQLNEVSDRKVQGLLRGRERRFSNAVGVFDPGAGRKEHYQLQRAQAAAQRRNERTGSNVKTEEYEIYELVLEHLLDEGYVDTVEGALAILENMSDEWLEDIIEAREEGVKPYRPNPTQAEIRERQRASKKKDDRPGWKDRSHIKAEGPLITAHPGKADDAKETLRKTLPDGGRIMAPGFFPSRTADRVAAITSSFTRGESPGGGDPQATRMPGERKPRRVIPSRLDRKK